MEIGQALDKGFQSDRIYLDFQKAFDSVCHTRVLTKLECYGIYDPFLKWFKSYFHDRFQRVVINGLCSSWKDVKSGVSQGSSLGPILYLIYVNNMPNVTTATTLAMFTDDSSVINVLNQSETLISFKVIWITSYTGPWLMR